MATAPKIPLPIHEIENVLAFRTKVGAETIKGGESKNLGTVDTSRSIKSAWWLTNASVPPATCLSD